MFTEGLILFHTILIVIFFATGLILFLPDSLIKNMHLEDIKYEYRFVLRLSFAITLFLLLYIFITSIISI